MSAGFGLAQKLADAILYEGYVLYPYRASSAKNRVRFQFGVVAPRGYAESGGSEPWEMQTECLVEPWPDAAAGDGPRVDLKIRCLQLQARTLEDLVEGSAEAGEPVFRPVESLDGCGAGGELLVAWEEGFEREIELSGIALGELLREAEGGRSIPFDLAGSSETEDVLDQAGALRGRLVRRRWPISAVVRLSAEPVPTAAGAPDLLRLRVRIENLTAWPDGGGELTRDDAVRRSLVSAHTLLSVAGGGFVSLLDPPPDAATAAAACVNRHTWPVLVGPERSRDVVLSSPIILYDHPAIAPESPGDLCDATEIDEILTLRIMTLTDEEKREACATDARARRIVEGADTIPREIFERLHGAVRSLRGGGEEAPADVTGAAPGALAHDGLETLAPWGPAAVAPEIAGWEEFLNPPGETAPEEASIVIAGALVAKGSRVVLRPSRRADSMDFFLAGREARVEGVFRDVEDATYVAVTLADDPNHDLQAGTGRFFYFYPDEIEPLQAAPAAGSEHPRDHREETRS